MNDGETREMLEAAQDDLDAVMAEPENLRKLAELYSNTALDLLEQLAELTESRSSQRYQGAENMSNRELIDEMRHWVYSDGSFADCMKATDHLAPLLCDRLAELTNGDDKA